MINTAFSVSFVSSLSLSFSLSPSLSLSRCASPHLCLLELLASLTHCAARQGQRAVTRHALGNEPFGQKSRGACTYPFYIPLGKMNPKGLLMFIPLSPKGVYTPYVVGWKPRKPRGMNKGYALPPLEKGVLRKSIVAPMACLHRCSSSC